MLICFTLLAVLLIPVHLILSPYAYDDAYIHVRIADHLAFQGVPYFNLNEAVNADSSPGWVIVLAFLFRFTSVDPRVIALLNAFITAAGTILFAKLSRDLTSTGSNPLYYFIPGLLYLSFTIQPSIGLMEIPAAMLLMTIALYKILRSSPYAFLVLGLLISFRPEFVALLVLVFFYAVLAKRLPIKKALACGLIGVIPVLTYQLYFFHSLVSNSMVAKARVYSLDSISTLLSIAASLMPNISLPFLSWSFSEINTLIYIVLCFLLSIVCLIAGARKNLADTRGHLIILMMAFSVSVMAAYIAERVLLFPWYIPIYAVPTAAAVYWIVLGGGNRLLRSALAFLILPIFLSLMASLFQVVLSGTIFPVSFYPDFSTGARVRKYVQVGEELYARCPDKTLASSEIGGLGYGFKGSILDAAGLVSPQALAFHPMKVPEERSLGAIGAVPVGFIDLVNPQVIVGYDIFLESFLKSQSVQSYVRIKDAIYLQDDLRLSGGKALWQSQYLNVFESKSLLENGISCYEGR